MSVKKIFTWIYLLCKHILKMPVIFILLLIIPAVTLTFRLLPGSASQAGIYAGIYFERDRKSTRLNSSHIEESRMPSSA